MLRRILMIVSLVAGLGLCASLFAQGLTTTATKDDWEDINFEFNSSILSDGYPSLLRLADLLSQHPDYKVKVEGNTDYIGSDGYNDKLARCQGRDGQELPRQVWRQGRTDHDQRPGQAQSGESITGL